MKKSLLVWVALIIGIYSLHAQNDKDCATAQDSVKARFTRKELSFYATAKTTPKVLYFYKIDNKHYERTLVKKMKTDTSVLFMSCYNKAYQLKLDSVFKCDFFRKVDSVTTIYDYKGMGYRAPQFRGGQDSLNIWLNKNITLPAEASPDDSDKNIHVYYFAQIDEKGNVIELKFAKTNCKACEPVVTEALKKLPLFLPATQGGTPTKSTFILPYSHKAK
jgi:hypothetical protein